jgi:hypothetical protein
VKALDWYAGEGGYTLALRRAGVEVVGACERDAAKRAAYAEACGVPAWFGEDCVNPENVPEADLWCGCESNPRLAEWVRKVVTPRRPRWCWCETVRQTEGVVIDALLDAGYFVTTAKAGCRIHIVGGPSMFVSPSLAQNDRTLGPRSDAGALAIIIAAIMQEDARCLGT